MLYVQHEAKQLKEGKKATDLWDSHEEVSRRPPLVKGADLTSLKLEEQIVWLLEAERFALSVGLTDP